MQRRKELFKAEVICDGFVEETGLRLKSFHLLQLSGTEAGQVIIPGSTFILSQPNEMILTKFPFCGTYFPYLGNESLCSRTFRNASLSYLSWHTIAVWRPHAWAGHSQSCVIPGLILAFLDL